MAESNPLEKEGDKEWKTKAEHAMTRFPPLSLFFPMLITVFVFLGDEGLHALCNICVNHSFMSLSGYKKERFSSTKTYLLCAYALLGFDAEWEGGRGGRTQREKKAGGVKNEAVSCSSNIQKSILPCQFIFPSKCRADLFDMTGNGRRKEIEK